MLTLHRLHLGTNRLIRAAAKLRPTRMMSFSMAETDLSEGLRAASAATLMLIVGELLREPFFAWAAISAFWT